MRRQSLSWVFVSRGETLLYQRGRGSCAISIEISLEDTREKNGRGGYFIEGEHLASHLPAIAEGDSHTVIDLDVCKRKGAIK